MAQGLGFTDIETEDLIVAGAQLPFVCRDIGEEILTRDEEVRPARFRGEREDHVVGGTLPVQRIELVAVHGDRPSCRHAHLQLLLICTQAHQDAKPALLVSEDCNVDVTI